MRWKDKPYRADKCLGKTSYKRVFLFIPRWLEDTEEWAWLERVWRMKTYDGGYEFSYSWWDGKHYEETRGY